MAVKLNINTSAVVEWTNKLEKMHRSALPVAIRTTLNSAAFDVKKNTLLSIVDKTFDKRQANFFRANSKVDIAKGFNVNSMEAIVGMKATGRADKAVKELLQQEKGGSIERSFIPLSQSRVGKSHIKSVRKQNRLSNLDQLKLARNSKAKTKTGRFHSTIEHAGVGGVFMDKNPKSGKMIVWRVNSLRRTKSGQPKLTPLYSFNPGRRVRINATHFMERASKMSAQRLPEFFVKEAQKQINRLK